MTKLEQAAARTFVDAAKRYAPREADFTYEAVNGNVTVRMQLRVDGHTFARMYRLNAADIGALQHGVLEQRGVTAGMAARYCFMAAAAGYASREDAWAAGLKISLDENPPETSSRPLPFTSKIILRPDIAELVFKHKTEDYYKQLSETVVEIKRDTTG